MTNLKTLAVVPAVLLLALLGGCAKAHSGSAAASSASAGAHAIATSSAGAVGKAIIAACVPKNALGQAQWFRYMASGPHSKHAEKGTQTREAFAACAGIPHARMGAFENDAANAAEAAARTAVTSKSITLTEAARTYLEATLPALVVKYRG